MCQLHYAEGSQYLNMNIIWTYRNSTSRFYYLLHVTITQKMRFYFQTARAKKPVK